MKDGTIPYEVVTLGIRYHPGEKPTGSDVDQYLRTAVAEDTKPVHLWVARTDNAYPVPVSEEIVAYIERIDLVKKLFEFTLADEGGWFSISIPDLRQSPITFELLKH